MRRIIGSIEDEYRRYKGLAEGAIQQLTADQLNEVPPQGGNSVAMLVRHISGNLRSRFTDFLTSDGEKDWRDRESEFARRGASHEEVRREWEEGWRTLFDALGGIEDDQMHISVNIRGRSLPIHEALHRSLAHTSYHVGQIVFLTRGLCGAGWKYLSIPPGESAEYNKNPTAG